MWEYNGPVCLAAYSEKDAKIDFDQLINHEQLKGYIIKIETLGDNTGIEITIDPEQVSEMVLIERIRNVTDKYRIELKVL